jgi:hypothetical protein
MPIAARREAQQRQRAEECAELVDRASFQKHQSTGRRTQRLGSGGHQWIPWARIWQEFWQVFLESPPAATPAMVMNSNTPVS